MGSTEPGEEMNHERFDRLIRIMNDNAIATGHADDWDDLLDSLEIELHDLRNRQAEQETEIGAWRDRYLSIEGCCLLAKAELHYCLVTLETFMKTGFDRTMCAEVLEMYGRKK